MTSTPCAACKLLRRKCTQECVFAPFFPSTEPHKFAFVHRVFGASNVAKILNELPAYQREDAVNSLFYEAEARLRDPVYGCVGLISVLQQHLKKVQQDLIAAKNELAAYLGAEAVSPILPTPGVPPPHFMASASSSNIMMPLMGIPPAGVQHGQPSFVIRETNQLPQLMASDTQRMGAMFLDRDREIFRLYDFNNAGPVTATGINQMDISNASGSSQPSLALGSIGDTYQIHNQHIHSEQLETQLMLQPPVLQEQPESQFLIQPMIQEQPEPDQEPQQIQEEQPQLEVGRPGSQEASN